MSEEVAELRGRVALLEKMVTGYLLEQLLDVKLRAINAETTAIRAAEVIQQAISENAAPGATEEVADGVFDVRGGVAGRRPRETKENLDDVG